MLPHTLVTDFDGTLTQVDFYRLVIERHIPESCPDYWQAYRDGQMTHFEALSRYFQSIRATRPEIDRLLDDMQLEPQLADWVNRLAERKWQVVVTSAGCSWYIEQLLQLAGVHLDIHASPGEFTSQSGLVMQLPLDSPFLSREQGIDKAAVVQYWLQHSECVAFAGDGYPDVEAARLVPADLRFARGDLAAQLSHEGLHFRSYARWADVAKTLIGE